MQAVAPRSWRQLKSTVPLSRDNRRQAIIRDISDRILRANGEHPARWEMARLASPQVNVFAPPGGRIGVFECMFEVASDPDQLATVIGVPAARARMPPASG